MAKPWHHILDIYGAHLHAASDLKGWTKIRKQVTSLEENPGGLGHTSTDILHADNGPDELHFSVFIDVAAHGNDPAGIVETCAHEASHVATFLFDHIREPITPPAEAHAYLTGWVTAWLIGGIDWPTSEQRKKGLDLR